MFDETENRSNTLEIRYIYPLTLFYILSLFFTELSWSVLTRIKHRNTVSLIKKNSGKFFLSF